MANLEEVGKHFGTDKSSIKHGYLNLYERYLSSFRYNNIVFMEIGVHKGESIRMWDWFFKGSETKIIGIDNSINGEKLKSEIKRFEIFCGDQEDRNFLKSVISNIPCFDIIIDDGGHLMEQQQISFGFLFKYIKSGGIYIIEDLFTSYINKGIYKTNKSKTLDMLRGLTKHKKIKSDFITVEESEYIEKNFDRCNIEKGKISEIAFIRKK